MNKEKIQENLEALEYIIANIKSLIQMSETVGVDENKIKTLEKGIDIIYYIQGIYKPIENDKEECHSCIFDTFSVVPEGVIHPCNICSVRNKTNYYSEYVPELKNFCTKFYKIDQHK